MRRACLLLLACSLFAIAHAEHRFGANAEKVVKNAELTLQNGKWAVMEQGGQPASRAASALQCTGSGPIRSPEQASGRAAGLQRARLPASLPPRVATQPPPPTAHRCRITPLHRLPTLLLLPPPPLHAHVLQWPP